MKTTLIAFTLMGVLAIAACSPAALQATPTPTEDNLLRDIPAVQAAITALSEEINVTTQEIKVLDAEAVMWNNSCLGIEIPGMMCLEVITPGYLILLENSGKTYEAHTNQDGSAVLFASAATQ